MDTRTTICRACGIRIETTAPPVIDELAVCARCARLPVVRYEDIRPVTICRMARSGPRAPLQRVRAA